MLTQIYVAMWRHYATISEVQVIVRKLTYPIWYIYTWFTNVTILHTKKNLGRFTMGKYEMTYCHKWLKCMARAWIMSIISQKWMHLCYRLHIKNWIFRKYILEDRVSMYNYVPEASLLFFTTCCFLQLQSLIILNPVFMHDSFCICMSHFSIHQYECVWKQLIFL